MEIPLWFGILWMIMYAMMFIIPIVSAICIIVLIIKFIRARQYAKYIENVDTISQKTKEDAKRRVRNYKWIIIIVSIIVFCEGMYFVISAFGVQISDKINEKKYKHIADKTIITSYTECPYMFFSTNEMGYTEHNTMNIISSFEYEGKKYILYPGLDYVRDISDYGKGDYFAKIKDFYVEPVHDIDIYTSSDGLSHTTEIKPYIKWSKDFDTIHEQESLEKLEKHFYSMYIIDYAPEGRELVYVEEQFYYDYEWSKKELLEIANFTYPIDWSIYCADDAEKYDIDVQNTEKADFAGKLPNYINKEEDIITNIYHSDDMFPNDVCYGNITLHKYEYDKNDNLCELLSKKEKSELGEVVMTNIYVHDGICEQVNFHKLLLNNTVVYISYMTYDNDLYMHYAIDSETISEDLFSGDIVIYVLD